MSPIGGCPRKPRPRKPRPRPRALAALAALCALEACRPLAGPAVPPEPATGCGAPATRISAIQGPADTSPLAGNAVEIEAIVTAGFPGEDRLGGLFVQAADGDTDEDPATSEGLFVGTTHSAAPGDRVRLHGTVAEVAGRTQLGAVTRFTVCSSGHGLPAPVSIALPRTLESGFEHRENMRVRLAGPVVINDVYSLWLYGEFTVGSKRHFTPTQVAEPGPAAQAVAAANARGQLVIDDGYRTQNRPVAHTGRDDSHPFAADNPIRAGHHVSGLSGVLHEALGSWRLLPTDPFTIDEHANPRTAAPDEVGGKLRIASYNVLNYFTTPAAAGPACGPDRNKTCRGADSQAELARQTGKTVAALQAMDADILGLVELENDAGETLAALVRALNAIAGPGRFETIATGTIGNDVIRPGLLYRPERVTPVGSYALLTRAADARFHEGYNRPALAQTFCDRTTGVRFTVSVNHLKSKGSSCVALGDPDTGDGQGNCNRTRLRAAAALADWIQGNPTGSGAELLLILGDLNANAREDPIRALQAAGFVNLAARATQDPMYSFSFRGQAGEIDYAFGNAALSKHVTGATVWHINADEAPALDYNEEFGKPADYYRPDPYRASDHDPVIVGLDFSLPEPPGTPAACP